MPKDRKFIENALEVMKFKIDDKEKDLVQYVYMREYGIATKEKPLLFTTNLQTCIALIAYEKNFSFLAHINVYAGNWNEDFEVEGKCDVKKCKKVDDLYREILKHKENINETINIGLVYGVCPVDENYKSRLVLERDLIDLFQKLRANNISAVRLPDINTYSFILDSRTGNIIHDGTQNGNKITSVATITPNLIGEKKDDKEK